MNSPHRLPPGLYKMSINGNEIGVIAVRGLLTDGGDASKLIRDYGGIVEGDTIEYFRVTEVEEL